MHGEVPVQRAPEEQVQRMGVVVALMRCCDKVSYIRPSFLGFGAVKKVMMKGTRMSHYGSDLKADGHGEVWLDIRPETKFKQYGWRCTTKEDSYCNKTLIGNWNQERYDLGKLEERKPMASQYAHYYETSYNAEYHRNNGSAGRQVFKREPHVFPGHQPELNPPQPRPQRKSCYMIDYGDS